VLLAALASALTALLTAAAARAGDFLDQHRNQLLLPLQHRLQDLHPAAALAAPLLFLALLAAVLTRLAAAELLLAALLTALLTALLAVLAAALLLAAARLLLAARLTAARLKLTRLAALRAALRVGILLLWTHGVSFFKFCITLADQALDDARIAVEFLARVKLAT